MKSQYEHDDLEVVSLVRLSRPGGADRNPRGKSLAVSAVILTMIAALLAAPGRSEAKSLYVIAAIVAYDRPSPIHAYNIAPDGILAFQTEHGIRNYGNGVVGITVDSYSEQLFITFEESNTVLLLNATEMDETYTTSAQGAVNLAGIVYDHHRGLLYVVDRGTQNLYSYQWNAAKRNIQPLPNSPFQLAGATAYGIALDEISDLLYVGNATGQATVYSTWDWRLMRTIPLARQAISVAVDPERGYLYYGAGYMGSRYLNRYDLTRNTEKEIEIAPDAGVIGIATDTMTGMVYVTTGVDNKPGGDDLVALTPELEILQTIEDIGSATGLVVPLGQTGYNPLHLTKTIKSTPERDPNDHTLPPIIIGDEITYLISFDYQGLGLTQVSVVDRLPEDMIFVDATGNGDYGRYDPNTHTYIWRNPPVTTARATLQLVARLKPTTPLKKVILNIVTLNTDKTPPTTTGVEAVATEAIYRPLNINKTVVTASTSASDSGDTVYVSPGDPVAYQICVDNKNNDHAVGNVFIRDSLPPQVEFVSATGGGAYDSASHTYVWSYPWLSAGQSVCVNLVVRVDQDVVPGTIITNKATLHNERTEDTEDTADVIVMQPPLQLRKVIVAGAGGEPDDRGRLRVNAGGEVTYALTYQNPSPDQTITRVSLLDTLPPEVSFVRAETEDNVGSYDPDTHTFTWLCNPVAPQEEVTVRLTARVDGQAAPGTVISNWAIIRSQEAPPMKARADAVVGAEPVQVQVPADLFFKPPHLFRNNSKETATLMVVLHLPEGLGKELIAETRLVMTPGNIRATSQSVFGTSTQGKIVCFFRTKEIFAATQGYGGFELTVTGQLTDGRSFVGKGVLSIFRLGGGP